MFFIFSYCITYKPLNLYALNCDRLTHRLKTFFAPHAKRLVVAAKILFTALALWLLFSKLDWRAVLAAMLTANLPLLCFSLALLPLNLLFETLKWHAVVRRYDAAFSLRSAAESTMLGMSLGAVTPARAGEYAAKVWYLKRLSVWQIAALTFLNGQLVTFITALAGFAALAVFFNATGQQSLSLTMSLLALCTLAVPMGVAMAVHRSAQPAPQSWLQKKIGMLRLQIRYTGREWAMLLGLASARYAVFALQYSLLMLAVDGGKNLLFTDALTVSAATLWVKSLVPFSIGDLGVRELTSAYFLVGLGERPVTGASASLFIFLINTVLPALAGLFYLPKLRLPPAPERNSAASATVSPAEAR